jgi:hypothetical protein
MVYVMLKIVRVSMEYVMVKLVGFSMSGIRHGQNRCFSIAELCHSQNRTFALSQPGKITRSAATQLSLPDIKAFMSFITRAK